MNIAIVGYGKMGKLIDKLATKAGHKIVSTIDSKNMDKLSSLSSSQVDLAIEFTHPEAALQNYRTLLEKGIPVVTGTTGWHDKIEEVRTLVSDNNGAFFYASNFSIGVNIAFKLNKILAKLMEDKLDYSLIIKEVHHTTKKDSPSGTAVSLAEQVINNNKHKLRWMNAETSETDIIPIISERVTDAKGYHEIEYDSTIDTIKIIHNAKSREGFALGALSAAKWLIGKEGMFTMEDMLNED